MLVRVGDGPIFDPNDTKGLRRQGLFGQRGQDCPCGFVSRLPEYPNLGRRKHSMKLFSAYWSQAMFGVLLALSGCTSTQTVLQNSATPAEAEPAIGKATVKALFCSHGSIGARPAVLPPGFETQFATAVVEIDSPSEIKNVAVSDFVLLDQAGNETKFKRVIKVEEFDKPPLTNAFTFAYYLNEGGTRPWNGTLPAGKIRLRISVALLNAPIAPVRFRLKIGNYVIEGPNTGAWPTY